MRKYMSLLLCLLFLFLLCTPAASAEEIRTVTVELPRYAAPDPFTKDYSAAAARILDGLQRGENPINVSKYRIPTSDALSVFVGVLSDHPEFFYIKTGLSYSYNSNTNTLIDITYFETASGSELQAQKEALAAAANEILSDMDETMTEVEKILYLHDTLALRIDYDYENYNAGSIPDASYTAYGAMVNGVAVCQGYSMAFTYLAEQVGIESCFVSSESMNHGWNAVRADGEWYYMDITHDDAVLSMNGSYVYNTGVGHSRFLLSESELTAAGYSTDREIISIEHDDAACLESLDAADYLWQLGPDGPFLYADGLWHYAENGVIYASEIDGSDKSVVYDDAAEEMYQHSHFLMQEGRIYYNTRDAVYTVDPVSGSASALLTGADGSIVGLGIRPDGRLVYEGFDSSNQYYRRYLPLDFLKADTVTAQIADLPWYVTEADRAAVEAARAAYDALTDSQKSQVSNLLLLEEAERILREIDTGIPFEIGDANRDRIVSVSDVVALRRMILLGEDTFVYSFTDLNNDNAITVTDVVTLRDLILTIA